MTQHTSLEHLHKEPFDMEMALTQCKPTERGIQLQVSMKVHNLFRILVGVRSLHMVSCGSLKISCHQMLYIQ